jgi:hypothetical protein
VKFFISLNLTFLILVGCGGGGVDISQQKEKSVFNENLNITSKNYYFKNLSNYSEINSTVTLNNLNSLYLVFTRDDEKSKYGTIFIKQSASNERKKSLKIYKSDEYKKINEILKFNKIIPQKENSENKNFKLANYKEYKLNDKKYFFLDKEGNNKTSAVLKKSIKGIKTKYGIKNLEIWVSEDSYLNCMKKYCVDNELIDSLADKFLKEGENNDIYDWVSNIFGKEWGDYANNYNSLIGVNDTITILLTDIDDDNKISNCIYGYFYSKDNFKQSKYAGSNERLMIYLDSVVFANNSNEDYWKKEIYSTLAHEFQHMIHFYQRNVKNRVSSQTWLNEMLSLAVEDLIATKIEHVGPRGVPYFMGSAGYVNNGMGLYPIFNLYNYDSITSWYGSVQDYASVSAFSAYLLRNYQALKIFNYIVTKSKYGDKKALEEAFEKIENQKISFEELLNKFATAVILSDKTDLNEDVDKFNFGDFKIVTYKDINYYLGSINFYFYKYKPVFFNEVADMDPNSNIFYKVKLNKSQSTKLYFKIPEGFSVSLIAK